MSNPFNNHSIEAQPAYDEMRGATNRENKWEWHEYGDRPLETQGSKESSGPSNASRVTSSMERPVKHEQNMRTLIHQELSQQKEKLDNVKSLLGARAAGLSRRNLDSISASVAMTKEKRPDRRSAVDRIASKPRHWSDKEDLLLRQAVSHFGNKHWKKIAEMVPGRNHTQCLHRWSKVLAPGLKKGQWSPVEDSTLVKLAQQQLSDQSVKGEKKKLNWGVISKQILGRTAKQCRERWVNNLNPEIRKGGWSVDEDRRILELYSMFPKKWAMISKNLEGRTENAVKIRYKSLTRSGGIKEHTTNVYARHAGSSQGVKPEPIETNSRKAMYSRVDPRHTQGQTVEKITRVPHTIQGNSKDDWQAAFPDLQTEPTNFRAHDSFHGQLYSDELFAPPILVENSSHPRHVDGFTEPYGTKSVEAQSLVHPHPYSRVAKGGVALPPKHKFVENGLDALINSFDDLHSNNEPEPSLSPERSSQHVRQSLQSNPHIDSRGGVGPFGFFDNAGGADEEDDMASNKKRKPRNREFNLLRKAISEEEADFEVGDAVLHDLRGKGEVLEFDLNNRRGKPYKIMFDNGETHEYSIVQVREKLKKCSLDAEAQDQPNTDPYAPRNVSPIAHESIAYGINNGGNAAVIDNWMSKSSVRIDQPKSGPDHSLSNFDALQQIIDLDDSDFDALYSQQAVKF